MSGCQLGKPLEVFSMVHGLQAVRSYLQDAGALPLRDYVPLVPGSEIERYSAACKGHLHRSEPDDDINYTVLALMMLEKHGLSLTTAEVARTWLLTLPLSCTWTAERAALTTLANKMHETFAQGSAAGFDLSECSNNEHNEWIGAQIRADMYGWVCPNAPAQAAHLARQDASLSHRGEGVLGAVFIAALGASIPTSHSLDHAVDRALEHIPSDSECAAAIYLAKSLMGASNAVDTIHERYRDLHVVHTVNNLALVVWSLLSHPDDFSAAIGEAVSAAWDTDCNAATVGGLWGLQGKPIPPHWRDPWDGRVVTQLAGIGELKLHDLVDRTLKVANRIRTENVGSPTAE